MLINSGVVIDGVDITDLIAYNGLTWKRNDVDGWNAGRNIRGDMIRDRLATKIRLDVKCRPLKSEEHSMLMQLLMPEYVQVTYDDPVYGLTTKTMYANNNSSTFLIKHPDGEEFWGDVSFPLVER